VSNFNTKLVKRDEEASTEESTRAEILNHLRSKFLIPVSLKCHHICHCTLKGGGNMESVRGAAFFAALGASGGFDCRLFVFSDAIFFVSEYKEVYILVADIESVSVHGRTLSVTMRDDDSRPHSVEARSQIGNFSPLAAGARWNQLRNNLKDATGITGMSSPLASRRSRNKEAISVADSKSQSPPPRDRKHSARARRGDDGKSGATPKVARPDDAPTEASPGQFKRRPDTSTFGGSGNLRGTDTMVPVNFARRSSPRQRRSVEDLGGSFKSNRSFKSKTGSFKSPKASNVAGQNRCSECTQCEMPTSELACEARNKILLEIKRRLRWLADPNDVDVEDIDATERPLAHQGAPSMPMMDLEDSELSDFGLRELLALQPLSIHKSGGRIIEAGSQKRSVFFIVDGSALCRDRDVILVRRFKGEVLGEVSFYRLGNRGAGCDVISGPLGCSTREIPAHLMDQWRVHEPLKAARINRYIARAMALRTARQMTEEVIFGDTS